MYINSNLSEATASCKHHHRQTLNTFVLAYYKLLYDNVNQIYQIYSFFFLRENLHLFLANAVQFAVSVIFMDGKMKKKALRELEAIAQY